jgi:hypothetical protein
MSAATESQIVANVRAFLLANTPDGTEVIRAQVNKVPSPKAVSWIAMTPTARPRLATNIDTWDVTATNPTTTNKQQKVDVVIQLDVYGDSAADIATKIATLWRDDYAFQYFQALDTDQSPLYSDDPQQMPLISGEEQYVSRWTFKLHLQANLDVSTNQDFMATVDVSLIDVDVVYPPGA